MAAVYLGEHTTLKKPMAIKILHDHLTDTNDILARFTAEAQSVAAMRHPNIVQVYDFDMVDGRPYIAMEYVRGITFSTYLNDLHQRELRLPAETIAKLITALSSALDYAHERGIIHRDIKPANVILRQGKSQIQTGHPLPSDAEPILTDFGIARIRDASTQTATGTILGTPAYMSPEQVAGSKVDHRTDIYSMGIILYEMLAGAPPFVSDSDTPVSILMKHLDDEPPDLDQVSPKIQSVVDKALAKDPQKRFQWAGGMAKTLSDAIKPELTSILRSSRIAEQETVVSTAESAVKTSKSATGVSQKLRSPLALALGALGLIGSIVIVAFALTRGTPTTPTVQNPTQAPTVAVVGGDVSSPTDILPSPTPDVAPTPAPIVAKDVFSGDVAFLDDSFQATVNDLEGPPSGSSYRGWLVGEVVDAEGVVHEVSAEVSTSLSEGSLTVDYANPDGSNLLGLYHSFMLTVDATDENVSVPADPIFRAQVNSDTVARARLVDEVKKGDPLSTNLLDWLSRQAQHMASHARNAVNSINADSLPGAKLHSEHTINIIEGQEGEFYDDWNKNGSVENPGDEAGLLTYLHLLRAFAQNTVDNGLDSDGHAQRTVDELDSFLDQVDDAREIARQITLADGLDLVVSLGLDQDIATLIDLGDQISAFSLGVQGIDFTLRIVVSPPQDA
jgi:serine/threonine-protein kinase